jgi:aspartate 1-decarboxylase
MLRTMLLSKIHRATITQTDIDYVGSITIDEKIMELSGILENEKVEVFDINNGNRFATYVIKGDYGSGIIGINGAAARLVQHHDKVIIVNYAQLSDKEIEVHNPTIIVVEDNNNLDFHVVE